MELIMEIKPGEGGDDSKLLVKELTNAYIKLFNKEGWNYS